MKTQPVPDRFSRITSSYHCKQGANIPSRDFFFNSLLLEKQQPASVLPPKHFEAMCNPKGALHKRTANDKTVFHSVVAMCVANQQPAKCPRFAADLLVTGKKNDASQRLHNFQVATCHKFENVETFELRQPARLVLGNSI